MTDLTKVSETESNHAVKLARTNGCVLHLLRVTFEALAPLSSGGADSVELMPRLKRKDRESAKDVEPVMAMTILRDANGLPTIAGASMQGALRALAEANPVLSGLVKDLFGYAERGANHTYAARLHVGFACVHDAQDKAVTGLRSAGEDVLLKMLSQEAPLRRDHVALDVRHVADDRKKFERISVPIGTRFSCEISLWGEPDDGSVAFDKLILECIAALFASEDFRIGGGAARGYGKVQVIRTSYSQPDLNDPVKLRALRAEEPSLPFDGAIDTGAGADPQRTTVTLILEPLGFWRIGGHGTALTDQTYGVRYQDGSVASGPPVANMARLDYHIGQPNEHDVITALRDDRIVWSKDDKGSVSKQDRSTGWNGANSVPFPVPGSAIRGPLVHRALYHANRIAEQMVDADASDISGELETLDKLSQRRNASIRALLGSGKERKSGGRKGLSRSNDPGLGMAAAFRVDDGEATGVDFVQALDHNSIDRFTGGVRNKILFTEEALWRGEIRIDLSIAPPPTDLAKQWSDDRCGGWPQADAQALLHAIADVCCGRLAIGARSLGYCSGQLINWRGPDAEVWAKFWTTVSAPTVSEERP